MTKWFTMCVAALAASFCPPASASTFDAVHVEISVTGCASDTTSAPALYMVTSEVGYEIGLAQKWEGHAGSWIVQADVAAGYTYVFHVKSAACDGKSNAWLAKRSSGAQKISIALNPLPPVASPVP